MELSTLRVISMVCGAIGVVGGLIDTLTADKVRDKEISEKVAEEVSKALKKEKK